MKIFSLCFVLFINSMSIGLVFPIFAPLFTQSFEPLFSPDTALSTQTLCYSMILAIPTVCMIFGAPFLGGLSDYLGRKKVLLIGLVGIAFSFVLSAFGIFHGSLLVLFASRALAGFMDGTESIAQAAMIDLSPPENKDKNMSYATFAGTIGFIIGPIVGGFLAEPSLTGRFHYEIPFIGSFILTMANALALYFFLPFEPKPVAKSSLSYSAILKKGFSICFDNRLRLFSLLLFVLHWCLACFFQLSTLFLAEKFSYSSGDIGLFTTFLGASFSCGIFFVIHVMLKRLSYLTLLRGGLALIALSLISGLYLHGSELLPWVGVVPMMLGISMMYNVLLILISNSISEHEQGEAMGGGTALKALAWLVSGFTISIFYPNLIVLLSVMLAIVIISFASTLWVARHPQVALT